MHDEISISIFPFFSSCSGYNYYMSFIKRKTTSAGNMLIDFRAYKSLNNHLSNSNLSFAMMHVVPINEFFMLKTLKI